jgi:ATP-dependent helicase/nuclease subunit A
MLPAGAALDRILERSGYLALAATTPSGVEAGDLLHAVDRVRQIFDEGGSIDDAADALAADGEFTSEVESLPLEPGRSDVVRLMNLHKAKGLEADIVFLADPCGGLKPRVDVHIERRGNQALGWFKVEKRFERGASTLGVHADWDKYAEAELPFLEAEETRLLYVAATRARDMLVVSRQAVQKGMPAWGVLNTNLAQAKELPVPRVAAVAPPQPLDSSKSAQAAERATLDSAQDRARAASWSITSVTADAHHITKMTRATDASVDDPTKVVSQATPAHRADAGMAWGALIHGLLEHAMRHKGATRDDLHRLAIWLTVEEPQLRPVLDLALLTVYAVAESPFWGTAAETEHATEVPFAVCPRSSEVLTGAMDLVFKEEPHWRVVDYKTDVSDVDGVAGYQRQLDLYKEALGLLGMHAVAELRPVRVTPPDQGSQENP